MSVLLVNITGPDGKQHKAGEPVPKSWDADYVRSLVKSGGAGTQKAWDERVKANEGDTVKAAVEDYKAGRLAPPAPTILAELSDGSDPERVRARLRAALPNQPDAVVDALVKAAGGEAK